MTHQFVQRQSGAVLDETLFADRIIRFLYSRTREHLPSLLSAVTSRWSSALLGAINFDLPLTGRLTGNRRFLERCGVDLRECVEEARHFTTPRRIFERKIEYWRCRPLPDDERAVVSPADARVLIGSLADTSELRIKDKFFDRTELLGDRTRWHDTFGGGDFAIFRLTPDKYHYNHFPVAGVVEDFYQITGRYHSCNPTAIVEMVTPYSKNRRVVTVIQTDVPGGTGVGRVAMIEVVALMIGEVVQCYSEERYDDPREFAIGDFVRRGQPKSLYRPGSSTDVLLFEPGRIRFADDLVRDRLRTDVVSRFSSGFGQPLVETEIAVRSPIAAPAPSRNGIQP